MNGTAKPGRPVQDFRVSVVVLIYNEVTSCEQFFDRVIPVLSAINENFELEGTDSKSRKLNADIFIDDRNVGGFPGWGEVYEMISGTNQVPKKRRRLFG